MAFSVALSAQDNIVLWGRTITDTADGDIAAITFPNDLFSVKTGKGGNSLFARNESGRQAELTLRVLRGSGDDKFLQAKFLLDEFLPANIVLCFGSASKKVAHGNGTYTNDTYLLQGGVLARPVEMKANVEGDTEQAVSVYAIRFANHVRTVA